MDKEKKIEEKVEVMPEIKEEKGSRCSGKCSGKCVCSNTKIKGAIALAVFIVIGALAYYNRSFFVAATVDGYPIGRFAVMQESEKQVGKSILENLILKRIVLSEASKKGITVSNEEVNAEMTKIEEMVKSQGGTLEQALSAQGITRADLVDQILLQKKVEKLIPSKPLVTDEEIKAYISTNKTPIPEGKESEYFAQIKSQLEQQKLQQSIQVFVASLKEKAKVNYFVKY